jgi:hypothetical protein
VGDELLDAASVLADAYLKGVQVADVETLYEGLLHGMEHVHPSVSSTGRLGHEYYNRLGYVPCDVDIRESVACTLEYAYNDWCIYALAKALQRPQEELDRFARRALNYRNVFDPSTRLMRGRTESAAHSLANSKGSLGKLYRNLCIKKGKKTAKKAVARKLAVLFYTLVKYRTSYDTTFLIEQEKKMQKKKLAKLRREAEKLGYSLEIKST